MARFTPPDGLDQMQAWMRRVEQRLDALERGVALSGEVSVGKLRLGPKGRIRLYMDSSEPPHLLAEDTRSGVIIDLGAFGEGNTP